MVSDSSPTANVADSNVADSTDPAPAPPTVAPNYSQVFFKSDGRQLFLTLPPEVDPEGNPIAWNDVLQQLRQRLEGSERFWPPQTEIYLKAEDRLLDVRQLQTLVEALAETQLVIKRVSTSRRQTALAAITAGYSVDQHAAVDHLVQAPPTPGTPLADPLYLQTTVRSGVDIRHPGMIVILGDTNPGSALIADGDIIVWGRLRGMAHAGCQGDRTCRIMALQMQPTQLRIADLVARPPDAPPAEYWPEVAYVGNDAIRIARAQDFARTQLSPGGLGFEP
jgi:septum site-determining protein MinC